MKSLFFIIVFITIINYAFCAKDKGKYLELTNLSKDAYLVAENCEKIYICGKQRNSGLLGIFGDEILENCYYRDKQLDGEINLDTGYISGILDDKSIYYKSTFTNPDNCSIKRYAYVITEGCYLSSDGNWKTKIEKDEFTSSESPYYDIDIKNNRILTLSGWCTYKYEKVDANWMKYLDSSLKINQINIPGTHDSGTYDIGKSWDLDDNFTDSVLIGMMNGIDLGVSIGTGLILPIIGNAFYYHTGQTQDLNISDQLKNGIRYFDIRLHLNNEEGPLYLSHGPLGCYDSNYRDYLYFKSVLKYCIDFLIDHKSETIILHLKKENLNDEKYPNDVIVKLIENIGMQNVYETNNIQYKDYFFIPENIDDFYSNKYMPTLRDVRGKIVFFSRSKFFYINVEEFQPTLKKLQNKSMITPIGFLRDIEDKGNCTSIRLALNKKSDVCKVETNENFRYQDNYKLSKEKKWKIIESMFTDNNKFNDKSNNSTHTLNFMNIAFTNTISIPSAAKYMNKQLTDYLRRTVSYPPNEWYVLDFPSISVIREIYNSNFNILNKPVYLPGNKSKITLLLSVPDSLHELLCRHGKNCNFNKPYDELRRRDISDDDELDDNSTVCLQRKIIIDEQGNQQDIVKLNNKCVDNNLNKWRFEQSNDDKYFSIISAYDGKCLNYSGDLLYMQDCKNNNIHQDFTIEDDIICSRFDASKCFNGYDIYPTSIKPKEYENLTCSINFARLGIQCCSNQNAKVEKVDDIGNWGIENGKWCGIGYTRCSFEIMGYNCCSSVNTEVTYTDEYGSWGEEDGDWCGIGEANIKSKIRIRNVETNKCLITTIDNSNSDRILLGDCDDTEYSTWFFEDRKFISASNNKCLYVTNGIDAAMEYCDKVYNGEDRYKYFDIMDDKYICVKNNNDPTPYCLNGKNLRFLTSKNEYSEWIIENRNVISYSDDYPYNPNKITTIIQPKTTTSTTTTSTLEPTSECYSKAGYPCCSSEDIEIMYTDEEGNWGSENGDWCLITKTTTTTTTSIVSTTTSTLEPTSDCYLKTGYPCCSPGNTEIVYTDESGNWSSENNDWCLIIETTTTATSVVSTTTSINNTGTPTLNPESKPVWLYNMNLNQCLVAQINEDKKPKIRESGNYSNHKWYVDPYPKGYIRPKSSTERCITITDVDNGKIKVSNCTINDDNNNIFEYTNEGYIKSILSNECLGKGDKQGTEDNADGGYLKPCTNADDQVWQRWERLPNNIVNAQTKSVWIYNKKLNKCIYTGTKDRYRPTMGKCNKTNKNNIWTVPVSSEGFYKSEGNKFCFTVTNTNKGTVLNTGCSEKSIIGYNKKSFSIYSTLNKKKCLGLLSDGENKLNFNDCDTNKNDQFWELLDTFPN